MTGPPTLAQELARILRAHPLPIRRRVPEPACIGCGRTPAVRCCEMGRAT